MDRNSLGARVSQTLSRSLSARRAWIEMCLPGWLRVLEVSLSARRAWIEIPYLLWQFGRAFVALRKESVDRNLDDVSLDYKEVVALRKESVDRNNTVQIVVVIVHTSLSARRAWIEISCCVGH